MTAIQFPIIDPSFVEITDMWWETGTEITDMWWLTELDDHAALIELDNRLASVSRFMTSLN